MRTVVLSCHWFWPDHGGACAAQMPGVPGTREARLNELHADIIITLQVFPLTLNAIPFPPLVADANKTLAFLMVLRTNYTHQFV
jgi:hypothetical protein